MATIIIDDEEFTSTFIHDKLIEWAGVGKTSDVHHLLSVPEVNPNVYNEDGLTPIAHAALCDRGDMIEFLLSDPRVNPNIPNNNGDTPLALAVQERNLDALHALVKNPRVSVNQANEDDTTPLLLCFQNGYSEELVVLMKRDDLQFNTRHKNGSTPLFHACLNRHLCVVQHALACGDRRLDTKQSFQNSSPVEYAGILQNKEFQELFSSYNTNPEETIMSLRLQLGIPEGNSCVKV
jgi:ankyrin repeat protein